MTQYEIYWKDLTEKAQEKLKDLYHDNIDLSPIAIIDIEDNVDEGEDYYLGYYTV